MGPRHRGAPRPLFGWNAYKGAGLKNRDVIRANERYRSASRTLFQLGAALLAASAVKLYDQQRLTLETVGWLVGSSVLIWSGWILLGLLDSEDA